MWEILFLGFSHYIESYMAPINQMSLILVEVKIVLLLWVLSIVAINEVWKALEIKVIYYIPNHLWYDLIHFFLCKALEVIENILFWFHTSSPLPIKKCMHSVNWACRKRGYRLFIL